MMLMKMVGVVRIISRSGLSRVERKDNLREITRVVCKVGIALHEFV